MSSTIVKLISPSESLRHGVQSTPQSAPQSVLTDATNKLTVGAKNLEASFFSQKSSTTYRVEALLSVSGDDSTPCSVWASPHYLAIASLNQVYIYHIHSLHLSSPIELLPPVTASNPLPSLNSASELSSQSLSGGCWDNQGQVFVGVDRGGRIRAIDPISQKILFTKNVPHSSNVVSKTWSVSFARDESLSPSSTSHSLTPPQAAALLMQQHMYVIGHEVPLLFRFYGGSGTSKVGMETIPISTYAGEGVDQMVVLHSGGRECIGRIALVGQQPDSPLSVWSTPLSNLTTCVQSFPLSLHPAPTTTHRPLKIRYSYDNTLLFILMDDGVLYLYDATLGVCLRPVATTVSDFELMTSPNGLRIAMIKCDERSKHSLVVVTLSTMHEEMAVNVPVDTMFIHSSHPQQSSLFFIECHPSSTSSTSSYIIRQIKEAVPIAHLHTLLASHQFTQALAFVRDHGLEEEDLVFKSQVKRSFDLLYAQTPDVTINIIINLFKKISDKEWIINEILNSKVSVADDCYLLYEHGRGVAQTGRLVDKVSVMDNILRRLATFLLLDPPSHPIGGGGEELRHASGFDVDRWCRFQNASLVTEMFTRLQQGDLTSAMIIWRRHASLASNPSATDAANSDSDTLLCSIVNILEALNPSGSADIYIPWIQTEVYPLINSAQYGAFTTFIYNFAKRLEAELGSPHCALQLLDILDQKMSGCSMITPGHLSMYLQPSLLTLSHSNNDIILLKSQLSDLVYLWDRHSVRLSLSDYSSLVIPTDVGTMILHRVTVLDLVGDAITTHIIPYFQRHNNTCVDRFLKQYISTMITNEIKNFEERCIIVIKHISNPDIRVSALVDSLRNIKNFNNKNELNELISMAHGTNSGYKDELGHQQRLMDIQTLLVKYGVKSFDVSDLDQVKGFVEYILSITAGHGSVEVVTDALRIADTYHHISAVSVYTTRCQNLVLDHQMQEVIALMAQIPASIVSIVICDVMYWLCGKLGSEGCVDGVTMSSVSDDRDPTHPPLFSKDGDSRTQSHAAESGLILLKSCLNLKKQNNDMVDDGPRDVDGGGSGGEGMGSGGNPSLKLWLVSPYDNQSLATCVKEFETVVALQREYHIYINPRDLRQSHNISNLLSTYANAYFKQYDVQGDGESGWGVKDGGMEGEGPISDRRQPLPSSLPSYQAKLFRLAEILGMDRVAVRGMMIDAAIHVGAVVVALAICDDLFDHSPSPATATIFINVALQFNNLLVKNINVFNPNPHPTSGVRDSDSLRYLPIHIHNLIKRATTICNDDDLTNCLALLRRSELAVSLLCGTDIIAEAIASEDLVNQLKQLYDIPSAKVEKLRIDVTGSSSITHQPPMPSLLAKCYTDDALVYNAQEAMVMLNEFISEQLSCTGGRSGGHGGKAPLTVNHSKMDTSMPLTNRFLTFLEKNGANQLALRVVTNSVVGDAGPHSAHLIKMDAICSNLITKILKCREIDNHLVFGYMINMNMKTALAAYHRCLPSVGDRYDRLIKISRIGLDVGRLWHQPSLVKDMKRLEVDALWSHYLHQLNISIDISHLRTRDPVGNYRYVVASLTRATGGDVRTVLAFCDEYEIDKEDAKMAVLEYIILSTEHGMTTPLMSHSATIIHHPLFTFNSKCDIIPSTPHHSLSTTWDDRVRDVVALFNDRTVAMKFLIKVIWPAISAYNYEKLKFILTFVLDTYTEMGAGGGATDAVQVSTLHNIMFILSIIDRYERHGSPLEIEATMDGGVIVPSSIDSFFIYSSGTHSRQQSLSQWMARQPMCARRLPLHLLLSPTHSWTLLKSELTPDSLAALLPLASSLNIKKDQFYCELMNDIVTKDGYDNRVSFVSVLELLEKVEDPDTKIDTAVVLSTKLVNNNDKIRCVRFAMEEAEHVVELIPTVAKASDNAKVYSRRVDDLKALLLRCQIVMLLTNANLSDLATFITNNPVDILYQIYNQRSLSAGDEVGGLQRLNQCFTEVALACDVNPDDIRKRIVEHWLLTKTGVTHPSHQGVVPSSASALGDSADVYSDLVTERKIAVVLSHGDLAANMAWLYSITKIEDNPKITRQAQATALRSLLIMASPATIHSILAINVKDIKTDLQYLMYMSQIDALSIPMSISEIRDSNKHALARGLLRDYARETKALRLICDIALDFNIDDVMLWLDVLDRLINQVKGLTPYIWYVLERVSALPVASHLSKLADYWTTAIQRPIDQIVSKYTTPGSVSPPDVQLLTSAIDYLRKAPCVLPLFNYLNVCEQLVILGMGPLAVKCGLCAPRVDDRMTAVTMLLQQGVVLELLDALPPLATSSVIHHPSSTLSPTHLVYNHIDITFNHLILYQAASTHKKAFLAYVLRGGMDGAHIIRSVKTLVTHNKTLDAMHLVATYRRVAIPKNKVDKQSLLYEFSKEFGLSEIERLIQGME